MKRLRNFINKTKDIWGFLSVAIVLAAIGLVCPLVYGLNDEAVIQSILSGAYLGQPDGHAIYMRYPLSGAISGLYRISDEVSWLTLFFALSIAVCSYVVLKLVGEAGKEKGTRFLSLLLTGILLVAVLFQHYVVMYYTIIAALLGGTAILLYLSEEQNNRIISKRKVLSLLLFFLCYMVRGQVFVLTLPFFLVAVLWKACDCNRENLVGRIKGFACYGAILSIGILTLLLIHEVAYGSEEWKEYHQFNEARTEYYDYTLLLPYDEYAEMYQEVGVSKEQFGLLERYGLVLDEQIDAGLLQKLAEKTNEERLQHGGLSDIVAKELEKYCYRTTHREDFPYNAVVLMLYLSVGVCCILHRKYKHIVLMLCLGFGRSFIWMYLMVRGRYPERVTVSLYLIEILLLLGLLLGFVRKWQPFVTLEKGKKVFSLVLLGVCVAFVLPVTCSRVKDAYCLAKTQENVQLEWEELRSYMAEKEDAFFYLDVNALNGVAEMQYREVEYENYMRIGSWLLYSPLMKEKQERTGYDEVLETLLNRQDTYIVFDETWGSEWFENYVVNSGRDIRLVLCDTVGKYCVYRVTES